MPRRLPSSLGAGLAIVLLAGCGGDGGGEQAAGECTPGTSGQTVTVCMKDIKYMPADAKVPVGGKVVWPNADQVPHTVTKEAGPGPDFDSGTVPGGGNFEQTFPEAGTIEYVCTIHPSQKGTLTVE